MMRALLVLVTIANWLLAGFLWSSLPERFPIHFDAAGTPDGWATKTALTWFALPALGTALGLALGVGLPKWMVAMAKSNSPWLNVPDKKAFAALPEDARVRVITGPARWLVALAVVLQLLLGWIVFGCARVAAGDWTTLPPGPSYALIGAVLVCAACLAFAGSRAVRREVARREL